MTFLSLPFRSIAAGALLAAAAASWAQPAAPVQADGAWVRASVPGQSGTGGFMTLTAHAPLKLVGVRTPAAGVAEVHEMKMDGDTMRMRGIPALDLPAHRAVELKPGGYHLMLMDLAQPLKAGDTVPLTLSFQDAQGATSTLTVQAPVRMAAPAAGGAHKH